MKKILVTILCFIETFVMSNFALAEDNNMSTYNLYVNSKHIEENNVVMHESVMLFPFRTILESLGASVVCDESNGDIDLQYKGKKYICYISEPNPGYGKYFYVKDVDTNENIKLTPMSMGGGFDIVNDYTYLYREAAERLFTALGCTVTVDSEKNDVYINIKE